jgi:LemA protein|nr:LemA family protein [Poseidonibacter ostreae]
MKKIAILLIIVIVLPLAYLIITNYNNVPKLDEDVKEKWSQVQNQYKRRADLIPNLVSTVKAYAEHEKSTFVEVTEARSKVSQINVNADTLNNPTMMAQFSQAQAGLSSALSKLMLVVEKYPDLKANKTLWLYNHNLRVLKIESQLLEKILLLLLKTITLS